MWNAEPDEAQAGIKIAQRNINNLRYADGTTLMAESEEELIIWRGTIIWSLVPLPFLKLLMKVKEESEKSGLKLNIRSWHPAPSLNGK